MKEYALPKTGDIVRIALLDDKDIHDVLALQEATRAALSPAMKISVPHQTATYFQGFLSRRTGVMIGIRAGRNMIAYITVMGPMELREAIVLRAITKNDIVFHHAALTDTIVVFKSMAVHPDWRGHGLSKNLLSFAFDLPVVRVADHSFAQIPAANRHSWDSFVHQRFGIIAATFDPEDKQPYFVFQKPAFGFDFAPAIIADDVDAREDFTAIANLTQREALIGVYDSDAPHRLAFMRSRDELNLMPTLARIKANE